MRVALILVVLLAGCIAPAPSATAPSEPGEGITTEDNALLGKPAPTYKPDALTAGPGLQGLQGEVVLVFVWASWCTICKGDEPDIVDMHRDYRDAGFEVMAVSRENSRSAAQEYAESQQWAFPAYHDPDVNRVFEMRNYQPNYVLVDRNGTVAAVRANSLQAGWLDTMRDNIEALL